eukprot:g70951.t1
MKVLVSSGSALFCLHAACPRGGLQWACEAPTPGDARAGRKCARPSTGQGLYSTLLYSTLLYSTLLYCTLLYSALLYFSSPLLYSTLYSTLYCYSFS